jgi:hypothetical protein
MNKAKPVNSLKKALTAKMNKEMIAINKKKAPVKTTVKTKSVGLNYGGMLRFDYNEPISEEILPIIDGNTSSFVIGDGAIDHLLDSVFEALYQKQIEKSRIKHACKQSVEFGVVLVK